MIILPTEANSFIVDELRERLSEGLTVTIAFTGDSMKPMIDGSGDKVMLESVGDSPLRVGDEYLFLYQGHCIVHRLSRVRGTTLQFRGDNCFNSETVSRGDVLARLVAVRHSDGTTVRCDSARWRRQSRRVVAWRNIVNVQRILFCRRQRRWERWVYFVFLLLLMWAPVGVLGVPLNNFVFGIRLDHLLHASVYIPCSFFVMDFFRNSRKMLGPWLVALLIAITTETVQYFLPYRGFDINDLVANFLGVTLGWFLIRLFKNKILKKR